MKIILDKYFFQLWEVTRKFSQLIGQRNTTAIFSCISKICFFFLKQEKKIAITQLNFSKFDNSEKIYKENLQHISKSFAEILHLENLLKNNKVHYQGEEALEKGLTEGAVALSAHIGCFELLAAYHAHIGSNLFVIGKNLKYESAQHTLDRFRTDYGAQTVWRANAKSMRKLSKALKSKALVASLIDQDTKVESKFSNFFNSKAAYPIAPIKLAIKYQVPIFTSFIYRVRNSKHQIWSKEIEYDVNDENVEQKILDEYSNRVQKLIELYPEQWVWWHRRWRSRKEGRIKSTNEYLEFLRANTT